jgi:hypothetical protein
MVDTLNAGDSLAMGSQLRSANGAYSLVMQSDGNLVLYQGTPSASSAVWATGTWSQPATWRPTRADMQGDGNFVLYNPTGFASWATGTHNHPGARLVLQDDRNVVVYEGQRALWASHTWIPGPVPVAREVLASERENVGWGKWMETRATLYRNGLFNAQVKTENGNLFGGLRGRALVVCIDSIGRAIWVSPELVCTTRCALTDPSCASYMTEAFSDTFPVAVAENTVRMDIIQSDTPSFRNLRDSLIDAIRQVADVVQAVKDAWNQLTSGAELKPDPR